MKNINDPMNQYRLKVFQQVASIELNESLKAELPSIEREIDSVLDLKKIFI